ncbi:unnamed protein product [Cochlearia groenlandica]
METESIKIDVTVTSMYQPSPSSSSPSLGFLNTVSIGLSRHVEEFLKDESDGTVTSLGSIKDSSSSPNPPLISLKLRDFTPNYVYEQLQNQFYDHTLSRLMSRRILAEAWKSQRCQQRPLLVMVFVRLTRKEYLVVSSNPKTDSLDKFDGFVGTESCAICLEDMFESETKPICELPNCETLTETESGAIHPVVYVSFVVVAAILVTHLRTVRVPTSLAIVTEGRFRSEAAREVLYAKQLWPV